MELTKQDILKYQNVSIDELHQTIQQTRISNSLIAKENQLFKSYLERVSLSHPKYQISESSPLLTGEQKYLVASNELKDIREEIQETKNSAEKYLEKLRVLNLIHHDINIISSVPSGGD
jgi:thiaminase